MSLPPENPSKRTPRAPDLDRLKEKIDDIVIDAGVPSVSMAIGRKGASIWTYASGLADKEAGRAATSTMRYRLASVTKPITAVAIMMLVDQGRIALDAPANNYLGDAKITSKAGDADGATIRRLLSHRAGLPLHYNLIHDGEAYQRRSLDETIARYGMTMLRPGVVHRYSNVGYAVLERVIERVSGAPYREFLERELFLPLGMTSADVVIQPTYPPDTAIPYTRAGDRYPAYDMDTRGAGGVIMTATDLVRFGRFFVDALHGRSALLSRKAAATMLQTQAPDQRDKVEYYVLGWVHELRGPRRQHDTIYHLGSTPGTRAELWIYPERGLVIATLVNEMSYRPLYAAREAALAAVAPDLTFESWSDTEVPSAIAHHWRGTIDLGPDGLQSVAFDFVDSTAPEVRVGGRPVRVRSVRRDEDGLFRIDTSAGPIPTKDVSRQPYTLGFLLERQGDHLRGYVSANRVTTRLRDSGNYAFWTELRTWSPDREPGEGHGRQPASQEH